jgi:hypothetical protein
VVDLAQPAAAVREALMATYSERDEKGRFKCVPAYPRKRKSKCGCALGGTHPCPIHAPSRRMATRHAQVKTRRVYLDEDDFREYQDHYLELEAEILGSQAEVDHIRDELASDVYDRGGKVDYRHHAKGRKAYTPTGRRVTHRPEIAFDTAEREARGRIAAARERIRDAKAELAEIDATMRRGYVDRPVGYLAGAARMRSPLTSRNLRSRYARR